MNDFVTWLDLNQIRFKEERGTRWYIASDVAKILGYSHPSKAVQRMVERNEQKFRGLTKLVSFKHPNGYLRSNFTMKLEGIELLIKRAQTPLADELRDLLFSERG